MDSRYVVKIQGKEHVTYDGLLDEAHKKGLVSLQVEVVQQPREDNAWTTICHATASFSSGALFQEIGDANPKNTNSKIALHSIRMAATRAKARALRDALNIKGAALEELGGDEFHPQQEKPEPPAASAASSVISQPQLKRLFAIVSEKGVSPVEVKEKLMTLYGVQSSKDLLVTEYDDFINNHLPKMGTGAYV